jgi:hypothetical protein
LHRAEVTYYQFSFARMAITPLDSIASNVKGINIYDQATYRFQELINLSIWGARLLPTGGCKAPRKLKVVAAQPRST